MFDQFKLSYHDACLVSRIVERAMQYELGVERLHLELDIAAVHSVTPLHLEGLLKAAKQDFLHDVVGIINHLNRRTGELENCFSPRYSLEYHK